jgi:dolichol-phosphate mannosyltransferase
MKDTPFSLSVILPTLNEGSNLEYLIPEINQVLRKYFISDYEIIVVDDGSSDETHEIVNDLISKNKNISLMIRKENNSLPNSIWQGIESSTKSHVAWLDADGSMDSLSLEKLILNQIKDTKKVFIGSRFVEGGGYKGQSEDGDKRIKKTIFNVLNSEDSVLAIYLSVIFNRFLKIIINVDVFDLTSGFIIGKKQYFKKNIFTQSSYGEYFILLVVDVLKNNIQISEVGYFCKTRNFGESKTSTNIFRLLGLSRPYIRMAFKARKHLKAK